ncbi:MAG: DUF1684 domain-containing protein [Candidatus Sulfotelmatobacter sp.]
MGPTKRTAVAVFAVVALFSVVQGVDKAASPSISAPDAAYVQSFEKWKAEQIDDLKKNWLPLAGLYWLKPGANSFGSAAENTVVFPKGPAHAGEFDLEGKAVTIKLLPEVHATLEGKPLAESAQLDPDTSGHPSTVEIGSLQFHLIVRGDRVGVRLKDVDSDVVRNFHGLRFYPLDMNYQIAAIWVPSDGKTTIDVPNVLGDVSAIRVAGMVVFKINGQEAELTDLRGHPAKGLFFVFNDLTAKTDTYPGGRFLETGPVTNGKVLLDFNRAYNPPCAVTPYATCPLAPKENRLAVAIPAGEKFDNSAHSHH